MGRSRSRSRSPVRRRRSRSRERDRDNRRDRDRDVRRKERSRSRDRDRSRRDRDEKRSRRDHDRRRSRSRSPRSRSRSSSRDRGGRRKDDKKDSKGNPSGSKSNPIVIDLNDDDMEGKSQEEIDMMKMMGFGGFDTTKGKCVDGNNAGAVQQVIKRKYRQYMNRRGGFNRPLDFVN